MTFKDPPDGDDAAGDSSSDPPDPDPFFGFDEKSPEYLFIKQIKDELRASRIENSAPRIENFDSFVKLGAGGMAVVFKARRISPPGDVALKIFTRKESSPEETLEFSRAEGESQAKLNHHFIVKLYGTGHTADGVPYLVMELVEDAQRPDRKFARDKTPLSERLKFFLNVAEAIRHAHSQNVIHCDIKPGNILMDRHGVPKILDFGLADRKALQDLRNKYGSDGPWLGSPYYMSPEQIFNQPLDVRTDIYSLGTLLYRYISGHLPYNFTSRDAAHVRQVISTAAPASLRSRGVAVHPDLEAIIAKCIAKEKEHRYLSVDALIKDLERHLAGRPVSARIWSLGDRVSSAFRNNITTVSAIAGSLFIAFVVFFLVDFHGSSPKLPDGRNLEKDDAIYYLTERDLNSDHRSGPGPDGYIKKINIDRVVREVVTDRQTLSVRDFDLAVKILGWYRRLEYHDDCWRLARAISARAPDLERTRSGAEMHHQLAMSFHSRFQLTIAEAYYRSAIDVFERLTGDKRIIHHLRNDLAALLLARGTVSSIRAGRLLLLQSVSEAGDASTDEEVATQARLDLAGYYTETGEPGLALKTLAEVPPSMTAGPRERANVNISVSYETSRALHALGQRDKSLIFATRAIESVRQPASPDLNRLASMLANRARIHAHAKMSVKAAEDYGEAIDILKQFLPRGHIILVSMQVESAVSKLDGHPDLFDAGFFAAMDAIRDLYQLRGAHDPAAGDLLVELGCRAESVERLKAARLCFQLAREHYLTEDVIQSPKRLRYLCRWFDLEYLYGTPQAAWFLANECSDLVSILAPEDAIPFAAHMARIVQFLRERSDFTTASKVQKALVNAILKDSRATVRCVMTERAKYAHLLYEINDREGATREAIAVVQLLDQNPAINAPPEAAGLRALAAINR